MAQKVKRLSTMWETWVRSLVQEDPLEKEMASHFSILPGEFLGAHGVTSNNATIHLLKQKNKQNGLPWQFSGEDSEPSLQVHGFDPLLGN